MSKRTVCLFFFILCLQRRHDYQHTEKLSDAVLIERHVSAEKRTGTSQSSNNLTLSTPGVRNCCCSKGLAPYWSNRPFLIFDIRALWRSGMSARALECQKLKMVGQTSMAKCKALTGSAVKGLRNVTLRSPLSVLRILHYLIHIELSFKLIFTSHRITHAYASPRRTKQVSRGMQISQNKRTAKFTQDGISDIPVPHIPYKLHSPFRLSLRYVCCDVCICTCVCVYFTYIQDVS